MALLVGAPDSLVVDEMEGNLLMGKTSSIPTPPSDDLATRVEAYHALKIDIAAIRREVAELEADNKQLWKAAKSLRGAVRIALDEWHTFTDHLDDSIAVRDILSNAYEDTAGLGL